MRAAPLLGPATQLLWCALLATTNCSVALKWDNNNLPCDPTVKDGNTLFCFANYSCQEQSLRCVRHGSLHEGESCTQGRQCGERFVCPINLLGGGGVVDEGGLNSCLGKCNTAMADGGFLQTASCANQSQVCLPFLDRKPTSASKTLIGGCYPSASCTPGASCNLNNKDKGLCVAMDAKGTTACMVGCQISWSTTLGYSDSCGANHSCVPVGVSGKAQYVCLYNGVTTDDAPLASVVGQTVGQAGEVCSPVQRPCADGLVCQQGVCAQYCSISPLGPCAASGQTCCPLTSLFGGTANAQNTGFCSANCTGS